MHLRFAGELAARRVISAIFRAFPTKSRLLVPLHTDRTSFETKNLSSSAHSLNQMLPDSPDQHAISEAFLRLFTREQFRIAGFVRSLVVDPADAVDVLQETSLELWRSFPQYDPNRDFVNWAFGVARHQVLKHYRTKRRDRLTFSEIMLSELADETAQILSDEQPRFQALRDCICHLTKRQRELIRDFYANGMSAGEIAKQWDRNTHAVYNSLREIRKQLQNCITMRLRES